MLRIILLFALLVPSTLNALSFDGKFVQGHFIIGKTQPQTEIWIDKKKVKVTKDGYFAFGIGRDRKYDIVITTEKNGKKEKIQLRMKVESRLHYNDEITKESWDKTGHISRKCYLVTNGPGTKSEKPTSGLDNKFDKFDFTKEESEKGYKNFCVIKCKIKSIEWLYLAAKGHRRALIDFQGSKKFSWLIP